MTHPHLNALVMRVGGKQPDLAGLAALQGNMTRHYFRLAQAQEALVRKTASPRYSAVQWALEAERARIARELHAGAGQAFAGIKIHLELIQSMLHDPPAGVRTALERIGTLAREALEQTRSLARHSYPPAWESMRLDAAVRDLWELLGIPLKFEASLDLAPFPEDPPHAIRVAIYRAAQEALANMVRHAGATRVALRLWREGGSIGLEVRDNGRGFDAAAASPGAAAGIGLRSVRDQAAEFGGEFSIDSGAAGTSFRIVLPETE